MNNDLRALPRCSIYARVSSVLQSENSVPDQIKECRRFIESRGWTVAEEHIYVDEFVSGACISRPGYDALKAAAKERMFDLVIAHDLSRLGRNHVELLTTQEELQDIGIGFVGASDGVETSGPSGEFMFQIRSAVAQLFLKDLAVKVVRGLRGQVERSYSAGGRTFGYRTVAVLHPDGGNSRTGQPRRLGVRVEIDELQAAVVRQIFELRAKGMGLKAVCRKLTRDGIPSPRYQLRGKGDPTWSVGTVLGILGNRKYKANWSWGRCRWTKDRATGRRRKQFRPESEWVACNREDLRIVTDELWENAQPKFRNKGAAKHANCSRPRGGKYLLSSLLKCGVCGSSMTVVHSRGISSLACNKHWVRGRAACPNSLRVRRDITEEVILRGIREHFLDPKVVMRLLAQLRKQLEAQRDDPKPEIAQLQKAEAELETQIANLVAFISRGDASESVRAAIHQKEGELKVIRRNLESLLCRGKACELEVSEAWLVEKLSAMRELMNFDAQRIPEIRAELQTILAAPISLTPRGDGKKRSYEATIKGKPLQILANMPGVSLTRSATGIRTPV